ncbi:MAG: sugar phosphate isomerase/epimerase [Bacillota bacterium]|nr:sugar phosphate isomerase/epimerase [Bacillota bacterium]
MRIGLSSASFYPDIFTENSIQKMKDLGFECGEIFLNSPSEYEDRFASELKENAEKLKFDIISVHAFSSSFEPFLFDRYERRRKDLMKNFSMVCKAASIIGARFYTFHGIRLIESKTIGMKFITDIYNELAYRAGEAGILLSQENVSWCMSSDPEFLQEIKHNCRYPLCFTLDIKQAYKAERKPEEYIEVMGKDLLNIHINDRSEERVCLLPGKGTVDLRELFGKLKRIDYKGDCIIEVYRENYSDEKELSEAREYIKEIINF